MSEEATVVVQRGKFRYERKCSRLEALLFWYLAVKSAERPND